MSTYNDAATLLLDNGTELPVTARLFGATASHRTHWGGTLTMPKGQAPRELYNLPQGRLWLVNGREGAFIRPDTSDWMESSPGLFQMMIDGNGDQPF